MQDHYHQGYPDQHQYVQQEHQEQPLDPAMERVRRKMVRLLAVSISVMLLGLMAVLVAVVYKINSTPDTSAPEKVATDGAEIVPTAEAVPSLVESQLELVPGTRLLSQSLSGDLLSLETLLPDGGTEIVIYDYRNSRFVGRLRLGNVE